MTERLAELALSTKVGVVSREHIGVAVSLMGLGVAALAVVVRQDPKDAHGLVVSFLTVLGITMCCSGIVVLLWPVVTKTIRSAHLVWPRERLYARYPSLQLIEHEDGCRAWARDMEAVELKAPNGYDVVRGHCGRCGAEHDQAFIPRGHPDYGVRCPGDD